MGLHLHPTFVLANRQQLEDEIERLISFLDHVDGDPDLEDGHDAEQVNEDGGDDTYAAHLPEYGLDQSLGPINAGALNRAQLAALAGLERGADGRWRKA